MVESTIVEVRVTKLKIRLLKVTFPGGSQIVVGGRLVSSEKDGTVTPLRDLPAYTPDCFPVPLDAWTDGQHPEVSVSVMAGTEMRPVGVVRACTLLFSVRDRETVVQWIRSQA